MLRFARALLAFKGKKSKDVVDESGKKKVLEEFVRLDASSIVIEKSKLDSNLSNAISWLSNEKRRA
ncbi:MAG: hypothetical protein ACFFD4_06820 [Candidatus Odinarchaeota archaeon]